jgi:predicted Ser/Thr protein kinase
MSCPRCNAPAAEETLREFGGVCPKCLLDFSEEQDAPAFPNLEIVEMVGQGGMGVVYKALQKNLGRTVALKVLSPHLSADPEFVERFTREARALASLSHPNIVGIYDSGIHDHVPYLVMEYVDGTPLRKMLASKKLTAGRVLEVIPQICDALHYAHAHGVVHRDIKPENILVDREGRVKIADFGLAKLASLDETRITKTGYVMGSPHYMAPEQYQGAGRVDHRADIYSLGVVFYEMLTGEIPMGRFKPPSEKALVDRRLDPVVLKSLEREPEDRWQSADEVKARVTRLDEEPAPHAAGTKKTMVAVAILAGIALLGLILVLGSVGESSGSSAKESGAGRVGIMLLIAAAGLTGIALVLKINHPNPSRRPGRSPLVDRLQIADGREAQAARPDGEAAPAAPGDRKVKVALAIVGMLVTLGIAAALWFDERPASRSPQDDVRTSIGGPVLVIGAMVVTLMVLAGPMRGKDFRKTEPMTPARRQAMFVGIGAGAVALIAVVILIVGVRTAPARRPTPAPTVRAINPATNRAVVVGSVEGFDRAWPSEADLSDGMTNRVSWEGEAVLQHWSFPRNGARELEAAHGLDIEKGRAWIIGLTFATESARQTWEKDPAWKDAGHPWAYRLGCGPRSFILIGHDASAPGRALAKRLESIVERNWSDDRR